MKTKDIYRRLRRLQEKIERNHTVDLTDDDSKAMETAVSAMSDEDVERLIEESGDDEEIQEAIRTRWKQDQERSRDGSHGNRWSMVTFRIALAIYIRSPAAYAALKSFKIFNLPSKRLRAAEIFDYIVTRFRSIFSISKRSIRPLSKVRSRRDRFRSAEAYRRRCTDFRRG
jgi:predicted CopG family antitoxin